MLCGHTYHEYCVTSYCEARGCGIRQLPCPICRFTAEQCEAAQHNMVPAAAAAAPAAPAADGGHISDEDLRPGDDDETDDNIAAHQSPDEIVVEEFVVEEEDAALPAAGARPAVKSKAKAKTKPKAADMARSGPPAKSKAKAKAGAAVIAGSGPPAKAKAKATAKSAVKAGSGPPAKAKAKATAKSPVPAGCGPPAKAKAKATAKSAVTAGPGPPAKASAEEMIAVAVEAANSVGDGDAVGAADSVGMGKGDGKGEGMFGDYVRCRSCNRFEHFQKCRLLSKQIAQNWRCSGCHVKTTQLYRQFGKWPTTEFEALDEGVKQNFMASLSGMDGPSAVAKANELLETYRVDEEIYTDGGQFLPLTVWATRGYDPSRVEAYSSAGDKKWHNVCGHVMQCAVVTILLSATIINNIAVIRCKLSSHLSPHHVSANGSL
jgi:hypothetical protein